MSSPNVSASTRGNGTGLQQQSNKPAFGTSKVIYIGKDRHPLTVQSLVPVSAPTFMKQSGFHSLVSTLRSQATAYQSADLIAAIADELPINTASASNEASIICESLRRAPFNIRNLQPCAFFDDRGSRITDAVSFDPAQRPANMAFVNFSCTIRCSSINSRILQPDYSFNFSLKLPQTLQPLKPPTNPKNQKPGGSKKQQKRKASAVQYDEFGEVVQEDHQDDNGNGNNDDEEEGARDKEEQVVGTGEDSAPDGGAAFQSLLASLEHQHQISTRILYRKHINRSYCI